MINTNDWNFISKFNFTRVLNFVILVISYQLSRLTKKNFHRGKPFSVSIEPTTSCNLRCPQCPSGLRSFNRPIGMLSTDLNKKIIDQMSPQLTYITYYFQGEPFLNTSFTKMVAYANSKNIYTATSSNGHYFTKENCIKTLESGLDKIIISIDGIKEESYQKYRIGGNFNKVLDGTKLLLDTRNKKGLKKPYVIWQFIIFAHNENEIEEARHIANKIGVDKIEFKTAQIYDFDNGHDFIPKDEKKSRYIKKGDKFLIKNKLLSECWRMWQGCVITWDGKVAPCCFDKDASYGLGSIADTNFDDIWKGSKYNSFRKLILKSRKNIDICQNCSEGTQISID